MQESEKSDDSLGRIGSVWAFFQQTILTCENLQTPDGPDLFCTAGYEGKHTTKSLLQKSTSVFFKSPLAVGQLSA